MAAGRVRPDAGPGFLRKCATGDEHFAVAVEHVAGKSQVQGGVCGVDRGLVGGTGGSLIGIEEDHKFGGCHGFLALGCDGKVKSSLPAWQTTTV